MVRRTPWVRMKIAASLDGKTALDDGTSQWITSEGARSDGHAWRARASAILTGIGTVREDDPQLDVRLAGCTRQPMLVVVDSGLETPADARLFTPRRPVLVYGAVRDAGKEAGLTTRGATLVHMPGQPGGVRTKVDLAAMLADLAARECNEVHVEAGSKLNGSLIREGLVDELLVYLAPHLIGQGRPMAEFRPAGIAGRQPGPGISIGRAHRPGACGTPCRWFFTRPPWSAPICASLRAASGSTRKSGVGCPPCVPDQETSKAIFALAPPLRWRSGRRN